MRPILFSLGWLNFYSYGFFTALAIIAAGWLANSVARKKRLVTRRQREFFLIDALLVSLLAALVTARLSYIALYSLILRLVPLDQTVHLLGGGFIFYAGLAAGLGVFVWWIKREEAAVWPWLDLIMVAILAAVGISEIGGYLNDGLIVHLAGLVGGLAVAGLDYALLMTEKQAGRVFWSGLFLLFLLYFFLGFWRPETVIWYGLTLTQWASFAGMAGVSFVLFRQN